MSEPVKKKRKQRPLYSCAECRRLKLKCDRQIPCQHCVRRDCASLCPNDIRPQSEKGGPEPSEQVSALTHRIETLERQLRSQAPGSGCESVRASPPMVMDNPSPIRIQGSQSDQSGIPHGSYEPPRVGGDDPRPLPPPPPPPPPAEAVAGLTDLFNRADPINEGDLVPFAFQATPESAGLTGRAEAAHGTLVLGRGGRSKYLGHTAASEWLKDQEQFAESQVVSRLPSPEPHRDPSSVFPFDYSSGTRDILANLPTRRDAERTVDCYFRYFAWQHQAIQRSAFNDMMDKAYSHTRDLVDHDELAVIFVVLAMGTLHDLELPINDPLAKHYMDHARRCLARCDFMRRHTIAAVQALHVMAHVQLESEEGRNGDSAWTLWGLVMRLNVAMGLHRDGERWGLPDDVVQERRQIFWECHSTDIMQANCFSRPPSLAPHHVDTQLPTRLRDSPELTASFHILKLRLAQITGICLDQSLNVNSEDTDWIAQYQDRLESFERDIPHRMRCRAAYLSLPSLCGDPQTAAAQTPEPDKRNLALLLQQFTLAINVNEAMLFLNRPLYAMAIQEAEKDPSQSRFGRSFLVVVERCNAIAHLVKHLHDMLPAVTCRMWWLWYHAFNAAVCLATLVLRCPRNPLVDFATSQVETTVSLMRRAVRSGISARVERNLDWLEKLQTRMTERLRQTRTGGSHEHLSPEETVVDEGLLGWRTRLVRRAAEPSPRQISMSGSAVLPLAGARPPDQPVHGETPVVTDEMLHQFWDPLLFQTASQPFDYTIPTNWWDDVGQVRTELEPAASPTIQL